MQSQPSRAASNIFNKQHLGAVAAVVNTLRYKKQHAQYLHHTGYAGYLVEYGDMIAHGQWLSKNAVKSST